MADGTIPPVQWLLHQYKSTGTRRIEKLTIRSIPAGCGGGHDSVDSCRKKDRGRRK
jgi:hypothetical protein